MVEKGGSGGCSNRGRLEVGGCSARLEVGEERTEYASVHNFSTLVTICKPWGE